MPTEFEAVHEVRFGIVMYGGVSLAVYINGVAQELLSLVRATAPALGPADGGDTDTPTTTTSSPATTPSPATTSPASTPSPASTTDEEPSELLHVRPEQLSPVERIYRELGQAMHGQGPGYLTQPVRTRFVVDIISGSSAGGINGVFLAKALANDQAIHGLKRLWVEEAGVGNILNDRRTRKGLKARLPDREPAEALFSGDVMYLRLLDALDQMEGADAPTSCAPDGADKGRPSPYVRDLDLWITATDLAGQDLPLRLADETITETQHRQTFHFVFGESQATSGIRNDFVAGNNPILAFAARATSAFPFAFVPARLADIRRVVRQGRCDPGRNDPLDRRWRRWFGRYLSDPGFDYQNVSFGDGGDTDNKPFSWVVDTLSARTSSSLVDRRLLYVEPDPALSSVRTEAAPRPDVVGSTIAAVSLGRVENIREDLEHLAQRTGRAERIATATAAIEAHYGNGVASEADSVTTDEWLTETVEALRDRGIAYRAYYDQRVAQLITEFSRSLANLPWHAAETSASAALRQLVARMVAEDYADPYAPDGARPTTKEFLRDFDIAYRVRRLGFVAQRADALYARPDDQTNQWLTELGIDLPAGANAAFRAEIRRLKRGLSRAEENLRMWVPSIRSAHDEDDPARSLGPAGTRFVLSDDEIAAIERGHADDVYARRADELREFTAGVGAVLRDVFEQSSDHVKAVLAPPAADPAAPPSPSADAAREAVVTYYRRFADFDQVIFPLQVVAGTTGELDPVEVHRVSPRDATSLVDPAVTPKVAGARLGHFGGFLDATWRANDIMWGRLDAAERLVDLLLSDFPAAFREEFRDRLQDAILIEEWYQPGRGGGAHLANPSASAPGDEARAWRRRQFRTDYRTPDWPRDELPDLGGRVAAVAGDMADNLADQPGSKATHRGLAALASLLSAVSMLVLLRRPSARAAGLVVALIGAVLIGAGALLNWDSASTTGWPLVGAGLAIAVLALLVRMLWRKPQRVLTAAKWAAGAAVVALAAYGGYIIWTDHVSTWGPFA